MVIISYNDWISSKITFVKKRKGKEEKEGNLLDLRNWKSCEILKFVQYEFEEKVDNAKIYLTMKFSIEIIINKNIHDDSSEEVSSPTREFAMK